MKRFLQDGKLITGINYWASDNSIRMWEEFHPDVIEEDFRRLSEKGITMLRVFPLWPIFQPLKATYNNNGIYDYRFGEDPLPDTEAGRAGVSEEACRRFEVFCELAERYGLGLIVGLITGHMSFRYFAPEPFQGRSPITDPTLVKWEIRFVKYFVKRMKGQRAIVGWDLGNEPEGFLSRPDFTEPDAAYVWASAIADAVRSVDTERPVVSGFGMNAVADHALSHAEVGEIVDVNTVHPYNIFHTSSDPLTSMRPILDGVFRCKVSEGLAGVPTFIQEVGAIGYLLCSESSEADFYRALLFSAWSHNCGGVMWWCAFDQGMQEYAPYDWNNIGSQYGFFRADGSAKPVAEENLRFRSFLEGLPFDALPRAITDGVCIIPRCTGNKTLPVLRSAYCLAKQANLDLEFAYCDQKLPDAPLYLIPAVEGPRAITRHRLMELLDRVRAGATLYISLGKGLFRMIPELTGLSFSYREAGGTEVVTVGGARMKVAADYRYVPEEIGSAEVLGRAADGRAVYLRSAYGKGYICLSTVSVEKYLAAESRAFRADTEGDYAAWYRVLGETVRSSRVLDSESPVVRLTEHPADGSDGSDGSRRYAVAVNYSGASAEAQLSLRNGWEIANVWGGAFSGEILRLRACDGAVLELKRSVSEENA